MQSVETVLHATRFGCSHDFLLPWFLDLTLLNNSLQDSLKEFICTCQACSQGGLVGGEEPPFK